MGTRAGRSYRLRTLMYDRCPKCSTAMAFHAITAVRGEWRRWVECYRCGTLTAMMEYGTITTVTNKPPDRKELARDQDYQRIESERFRQDYLRDLPQVQPDRSRKPSRFHL